MIPKTSWRVSAGIGAFNATYTNFGTPEEFAFLLVSQAPYLFYNVMKTYSISPITKECSTSDCISYFFSGGLGAVSPSPYLNSQFTEANTAVVYKEQGVQVDYWGISLNDSVLSSENCKSWGSYLGGFMICIKQSELNTNNLVAGKAIDLIRF